ncbi:acyltransferase family protein [Nevskia soli]|uniref:acyltransferase family protein n=1 Tax=Nevskia soli TaxID=418856 RepID=UPI00068C0FDF|nr:acyltransferase [Nevskia soli]
MTINSRRPATEAIPSLDGIRAIAVLLVFFAHAGLEHIVPGGLGVTIFFVLSGFLITTLMRSEYASTGTVCFRTFYLRRFLRLMPPLLIVIGATALLSEHNIVKGHFTADGLWAVLLYLGNYFVISHDFAGIPAGIGVVWSLAVEEHFYLFYPPLALLMLRSGRGNRSAALLSALCAAVLAWRFWLMLHGGSEAHLTMGTDTRVDAILVGCVMGLWRNPWLDTAAKRCQHRDRLVAITCVLVLIGTLAWRGEAFRLTARYTIQSLAIAPLIYLAVARSAKAPYRWLNSKPMVYLGTVSYSIYLSHQVIMFMIVDNWPHLGWAAATTLTAILTLAVAELMRRWVERPCARLRKRLHRQVTVSRNSTVPAPVNLR